MLVQVNTADINPLVPYPYITQLCIFLKMPPGLIPFVTPTWQLPLEPQRSNSSKE